MSHRHEKLIDRIEQAFGQARSELERLGSNAAEVELRLAQSTIHRKSNIPRGLILIALILFIGALIWRQTASRAPRQTQETAPIDLAEISMQTGDTELKEYIAGIIDNRAVVVIWSYAGTGISAVAADQMPCAAGKYQSRTFQEFKLPNGCTLVCSMLVPEPGVDAVLAPPSVYARSTDNNLIAMSVLPRAASPEQLVEALHSASAGMATDINVGDMLREIQR